MKHRDTPPPPIIIFWAPSSPHSLIFFRNANVWRRFGRPPPTPYHHFLGPPPYHYFLLHSDPPPQIKNGIALVKNEGHPCIWQLYKWHLLQP